MKKFRNRYKIFPAPSHSLIYGDGWVKERKLSDRILSEEALSFCRVKKGFGHTMTEQNEQKS